MDYRVIFVLLVKTAGVFLLVDAVAFAPDKAMAYFSQPEQSTALLMGMVVLPAVVPLIAELLLTFFPASVARTVVGPTFTQEVEVAKLIQPALFSGIGVYFTIIGLQTLVYYVAFRIHGQTAYDVNMFADPETYAGFVSSVFLVVAGIALLLGARGFSAVLHRLRHGSY